MGELAKAAQEKKPARDDRAGLLSSLKADAEAEAEAELKAAMKSGDVKRLRAAMRAVRDIEDDDE